MNLLNSRRRYFSFLLENHTDTHTQQQLLLLIKQLSFNDKKKQEKILFL